MFRIHISFCELEYRIANFFHHVPSSSPNIIIVRCRTYLSPGPVTFPMLLVQAGLVLAFGGVLPIDIAADEIEEERRYLSACRLVQSGFQQQHGKSRFLR